MTDTPFIAPPFKEVPQAPAVPTVEGPMTITDAKFQGGKGYVFLKVTAEMVGHPGKLFGSIRAQWMEDNFDVNSLDTQQRQMYGRNRRIYSNLLTATGVDADTAFDPESIIGKRFYGKTKNVYNDPSQLEIADYKVLTD